MTQRKLKIILINPYVPPDRFGTISPWDVPSLGLGYIAAVLEQNHKDVSIIDAFIERITPEKLNEILEKKKPDVIGLTANAYSAKYAAYMAYKIKQRFDTLLVMGGPYPTSSYQYLLKHNLADIIVIGEGEYTFLELINQLELGEEEGDISDIKGISYKVIEKLQKWIKNPEKRAKINEQYPNNIIINPRRPYIQDLDALPFPAWHLFPHPKKYKNLRGVIKRPYLPIFTTRGCDHACLWCNKNIHGYKIRARSVENVIDEIEYFQKKYGIKEFAFMDDNFTFDEKRIYKFCYLLKKRNIKIYINLYPGVRADKLSWKMIRALKSVGVTRITVGVESGNQKVVMKIGKGLNLKDVLKAVHYTKKAGLVADGFFMLGLPMDTERTMHETISFAKKAGFDHAYFFVTTPFPGTPLYTLVERKGTFIAKYFLGIPKHIVEGQPVFIMGELTPELVSKKFKEAYLSFYFRIPKIIKLAKVYMTFMLRYFSFSEIKWLLSQFLFFFTKLHYKAPSLQDLLKSMKD